MLKFFSKDRLKLQLQVLYRATTQKQVGLSFDYETVIASAFISMIEIIHVALQMFSVTQ